MTIKPFLSGILFGLCMAALGYWLFAPAATRELELRVPIPENKPDPEKAAGVDELKPGILTTGPGKPSSLPGSWPQFRGEDRDNIADAASIADQWPEGGPKVVWRKELGEGHAGAVVHNGRVYVLDYDEENEKDAVRCLSFDDGRDIWSYAYESSIKRNHGMSRTVPAVTDEYVVTLSPLCLVHCLRADTGELVWNLNLPREYGTKIPEWYAGQCPLIEPDRVILAPGGKALMTALRLKDGETIWETENPFGWQMTHSSILPIMFDGKKQYVWCASDGVIGVDSETGELLWSTPEWKIKIATVPSPLDLGNGRIFLTGGYNAGGAMLQLTKGPEGITPEIVYRTDAQDFGSDQQTPILYRDHIFGVIPGGRLACLDPESGETLWTVEEHNFGLGPYLLVDNRLLVLDDDRDNPGDLCLYRINPTGAEMLASARVVEGNDAWAPIAFASGRAILRDSKEMVCLDLREP